MANGPPGRYEVESSGVRLVQKLLYGGTRVWHGRGCGVQHGTAARRSVARGRNRVTVSERRACGSEHAGYSDELFSHQPGVLEEHPFGNGDGSSTSGSPAVSAVWRSTVVVFSLS